MPLGPPPAENVLLALGGVSNGDCTITRQLHCCTSADTDGRLLYLGRAMTCICTTPCRPLLLVAFLLFVTPPPPGLHLHRQPSLIQVMCFPSSHLSLIKGATANSKRLKRIHSLVDIDITMDTFEDWPYDLQQVCACHAKCVCPGLGVGVGGVEGGGRAAEGAGEGGWRKETGRGRVKGRGETQGVVGKKGMGGGRGKGGRETCVGRGGAGAGQSLCN